MAKERSSPFSPGAGDITSGLPPNVWSAGEIELNSHASWPGRCETGMWMHSRLVPFGGVNFEQSANGATRAYRS